MWNLLLIVVTPVKAGYMMFSSNLGNAYEHSYAIVFDISTDDINSSN